MAALVQTYKPEISILLGVLQNGQIYFNVIVFKNPNLNAIYQHFRVTAEWTNLF